MSQPPLFSVLVPTFGRQEFLSRAVASVLAQTVENFECVVIDDGSPEGPVLPDDPRLRLLRRPTNGGVSAARNSGLEAARGRYVTFLDDDDEYTPNRLAIGLEGLARASLALCWHVPLGRRLARRSWRRLRRNENRTLEGNVHGVILDHGRPHLGQVSMERKLAPPFDERFRNGGDLEWWIRASRDVEVTTVPKVGYFLRHHQEPRLTGRLQDRVGRKQMFLEIHADYFAAHPRAASRQWRGLGELAERLGDYGLARSAYRRSFTLDPAIKKAWRLLRVTRRVNSRRAPAAGSRSPPDHGRSPQGS